jgi:protoporphyrinogen oxidase
MEYGLKYHTTAASNMTTDWLGPRLYRPELREVFQGAVSPATPDVHYVSHFRYPTHNGFVSFLDGFLDKADVRLSHRLTALDPRARTLTFENGTVTRYDQLLSSIPLTALVPLIHGAPETVRAATRRLACSQCVMVNIGVAREDVSPAHWTYFYDRDFIFTRLSFPHKLSPETVPPGCSSIQAELYYSEKYRPLDRPIGELIEPTIADLQRCGLLRPDDRILFRQATLSPFANVIFDHERPAALATVHGYLAEIGVLPCGRYGEWGYQWTDESFISGEQAAQRALDRLTSRGVPA